MPNWLTLRLNRVCSPLSARSTKSHLRHPHGNHLWLHCPFKRWNIRAYRCLSVHHFPGQLPSLSSILVLVSKFLLLDDESPTFTGWHPSDILPDIYFEFYLTYIRAFLSHDLAVYLTFYVTLWHFIWHIFWHCFLASYLALVLGSGFYLWEARLSAGRRDVLLNLETIICQVGEKHQK